jgi:hypothetical protein
VEDGVKSLDVGGPLATLKTGSGSLSSSSSSSRSDVGADSGSAKRSSTSSGPGADSKSAEVPMLAASIAPAASRSSTPLVVGAAAFALLTAIGAYYAIGGRGTSSPTSPGGTSASAVVPLASSVLASAAPPSSASAPPVDSAVPSRVVVSTVPKGAILLLDGAPVSNPYEGTLADGLHKVRAQAAGFRTTERTLTSKDSGDIVLTLEAAPRGEEPAPATTSRPKKPKHAIDDTDPYK